MNELELIRDFRAEIPPSGGESLRIARAALAARMKRQQPWWRRRLVVAIAVALVAAVAAGAALGLGDRLVDLIRGKPAPESFQKMMEITHGRFPIFGHEITGEWRGVTGTMTPIGPAGIYAASTSSGGVCWHAIVVDPEITRLRGHIMGACGPRVPPSLFEVGTAQYSDHGRFDGTRPTGRSFDVLVGRVGMNASALDIHLCGARQPRRIPVRETFALFAIPNGREVERIVAFAPGGRRLGETNPPGLGGVFTGCP